MVFPSLHHCLIYSLLSEIYFDFRTLPDIPQPFFILRHHQKSFYFPVLMSGLNILTSLESEIELPASLLSRVGPALVAFHLSVPWYCALAQFIDSPDAVSLASHSNDAFALMIWSAALIGSLYAAVRGLTQPVRFLGVNNGGDILGADVFYRETNGSTRRSQTVCPEEAASVWSKLSFDWLGPLLKLGRQGSLSEADLFTLAEADRLSP